MHGHEELVAFADFADARPFGVPAVGAVVAVAAFGEAVGVPLVFMQAHEDERAVVPADGPEGIGVIGVAGDAAGAADFGELVAADELPVLAGGGPGGESAGGDGGVGGDTFVAFAVVGVDEFALGGVEAFAVVAGEF